MQIIPDVRTTEKNFPNVVLTVGSFDGVHLGHQCILKEISELAEQHEGTPAVLTMHPHPREFFSPAHAPNLLTSDAKKFQLFDAFGVEVTYILPFDRETANIEAETFIREILCRRCHVKAVLVGYDFRFGKEAKGDYELLKHMSAELGFEVRQISALMIEAERVSSTLVRERVLQGDLDGVETLLGRKYSLVGVVVTGRGRGAEIGFPTANIKPHHNAVPAQGVYIAEALINGERRPAAVNIGVAPTIRQEDLTIEAHILDYSEDLVGAEIEIIFHKRIRSEKKFPSIDELVAQIARDVTETRDYFEA